MAKEPENGPKRRQEQFVEERRAKLKPRESDEKGGENTNRHAPSDLDDQAPERARQVHEYRQRQRRKGDKK